MNTQLLIGTHAIAAAVGAVLGVFATQILHDLDVLAQKEKKMAPTTRSPDNTRGARFRAWLGGKLATVKLFNVLLLIVILVLSYGIFQDRQFASCDRQLASSLKERSADNAVLDKADKRVEEAIIALGTPGNDEADFEEVVSAYKAKNIARDKRDIGRVTNPYPDPSSCR